MPSGAKKRKAAKKKKENKPNNEPNPCPASTHGDDVKHHEDQDSDAGESREIKVNAESNNKDGKIEINEPTRKSYNGGSSESSSNGSSDDESHVLKNNQTVSNNTPFVDSTRSVDSLSETLAKDIRTSVKEADVSVVQIPSIENIKEAFDVSSSIANSVSSYETNSILNENGAKSIEYKLGNSAAFASQRKVDGTVIQSVENKAVTLDPKEHLLPEKDDRPNLLYNGVEHVKESEVTEPLLKPSLQPVQQKTSWKGCCGLFELFVGSGR